MLNLPVYLRGSTYYLHTRVLGRQVKKSLGTSDKKTAMILAGQVLAHVFPMVIKKFEIDLQRGIFKSDGPEDHARMMDVLEKLGPLNNRSYAAEGGRLKGMWGYACQTLLRSFSSSRNI